MKILLAPLLLAVSLPAFAEIAQESTTNADKTSTWLITKEAVRTDGSRFALGMEKLEMKDMEQCEEQGAVFMSSKRLGIQREKYSGFECLEGM